MKRSTLFAGLMMMMAWLPLASFSDPSTLGPTGIVNVPTAQTVPSGMVEMLVTYDSYQVDGIRIKTAPVATLSYGFAHGEVGVSYFNFSNNGVESVKSANVKYILLAESKSAPSIAAGVMYLKGYSAETDVYLVATDTRLGNHVSATAGLLYQHPDDGNVSDHLTGMVGMEFGSPEHLNVGVDYIIKDIGAGPMGGLTLRQPITPHLGIQVGIGNASRYFAGMTLKFGV